MKQLPGVAQLRTTLLHEFGHVVGLGHPDRAGQNVAAVMNLGTAYEELQPDDIAGVQALYGKADTGPPANMFVGALENPTPGAIKSGVGLLSGWACDAAELEVSFDGGPRQFVPSGSERSDTAGPCGGDIDNGFGLLLNYNNLGDGPHTVTLYADGERVVERQFTVQTLGTDFLRGVTGTGVVTLSDGKEVTVEWEEATQNFVITDYEEEEEEDTPPPPLSGSSTGDLSQFAFLIDDGAGDWEIDIETATGEYVTGWEDVSFLGYRTTASGRDVMVGHYGVNPGPQTVDFELGSPVDVLPRLPSFHAYRYALVLPGPSSPNALPTWQQFYGSQASAFCMAFLFNTVEKDRYGDINMPVTGIVSARDNGVCIPENGAESLVQPTTLNLEIALD